jgi:beta-exotoxin I transport system permease protein
MSRAVTALLAHSLRRIAPMLLAVAVLLAAFQFLLTQVATYFFRHNSFSQLSTLMPDFVRSMLGPSTLAFMSFSGIVAFGYFHPMVITTAVGLTIAIATEPAGEVESRFVDLTLARELTRLDVIIRSGLVFVTATLVVLGTMMLGTWIGLRCCTPAEAPTPTARLILSLAASLGTVMACWAGLALAVAAAVRRRAVAAGIAGGAALAMYLLDYLGRAWEPARAISTVSPFHFFDPTTLIVGEPLSAWNSGVLIAIGLCGIATAAVVFSRRDI